MIGTSGHEVIPYERIRRKYGIKLFHLRLTVFEKIKIENPMCTYAVTAKLRWYFGIDEIKCCWIFKLEFLEKSALNETIVLHIFFRFFHKTSSRRTLAYIYAIY